MKNKIQYILTAIFVLPCFMMTGQYDDYLGAGHSEGITVTASSQFGTAAADNTLNGTGLIAKKAEAGRFLNQATFGPTYDDITKFMDLGYEAWLEEQFNLPRSEFRLEAEDIWEQVLEGNLAIGNPPDEVYGPWAIHFNYAWWTNLVMGKDQLRQRMAYALSQIFVISLNSDLNEHGFGLSSYYDRLAINSFGNFRDLLFDVTMDPNMGYYLSHLNNPKENIEENIHPDENYAREIMQLFSIGLYELNLDGTRKLDANGDFIPTYDNDDIKQFARVFTGLSMSVLSDNVDWTDEPYFGLDLYTGNLDYPMVMYPEYHETGTKELLNGFVIPANQDPMLDINMTIDHLFNHENVGPFIGKQLIKRFTKSNPSPAYVERVATVFNDNGSGVRGDLKAVLTAILMDEEARSCDGLDIPNEGKVKEPLLRYTHYVRATPFDNPLDLYWNPGFNFADDNAQMALAAPTVFNFYLPDHTPVGELAAQNISAPELSLHDTRTAIGYVNTVNQWTVWNAPWWSWDDYIGINTIEIDYNGFPVDMVEPEDVIEYLDLLYTGGQLTDETRKNIHEQISQLYFDPAEDWMYRIMLAHYLLLISPDFVIQK